MRHSLRQKKRNFAILGISSAIGLYLVNRSINKNACVKNRLKKGTGHNYPWRYGDIYYTKSGNGQKNILLIHDITPYSSSNDFKEVVPFFNEDYTVYTLDLLGCGRSDKPAMTYTNYLYVQLITNFIDDVIQQPVQLVAAGLSSSFAIMTATMNTTGMITKVDMINPCSLKKLAQIPDHRSRSLAMIMAIPLIGTSVYNLLNSRSNLEYIMDEQSFYNPFKVRENFLDSCYEAAHIGDGKGRFLLASLDGKYLNWNINRFVAELTVPIVVIQGEKQANADRIEKAYRKLNPSITFGTVPEAKIFPQLEEPKLLANLIETL